MPRPNNTTPEIEIKLPITDLRSIREQITALGAAHQPRVLEKNILYDTPHSDLRRRGMLLRLRIETPAPHNKPAARNLRERVILTAKAPPKPSPKRNQPPRYKIRAEREQVVAQPSHAWAAALTALGFRPAFRYDKYRTTFRLPSLHLDLDETPVGAYLELEGAPKAIDRAARALGFSKQAYLCATYWDLYSAACRRRGIHPKNMLFTAK